MTGMGKRRIMGLMTLVTAIFSQTFRPLTRTMAGEIKIRVFISFGYFIAKSAAIWPPKEWPIRMRFSSFCFSIKALTNSRYSGTSEFGFSG